MTETENGNGNGVNGRFLKMSYSVIGLLITTLFAILGYLYLAQNSEIKSLRYDLEEYRRENERYKIAHEADKNQILIQLNRDLERIKTRIEIEEKSTSRK